MANLAQVAPYVATAFSVAQAIKKPPSLPRQPLQPMADDEALRRDRRKKLAAQARGRTSTIFTGTDYGLGG